MKYLIALLLLTLSAFGQANYVPNKNGIATNLTSRGIQHADKIVATNFTGDTINISDVYYLDSSFSSRFYTNTFLGQADPTFESGFNVLHGNRADANLQAIWSAQEFNYDDGVRTNAEWYIQAVSKNGFSGRPFIANWDNQNIRSWMNVAINITTNGAFNIERIPDGNALFTVTGSGQIVTPGGFVLSGNPTIQNLTASPIIINNNSGSPYVYISSTIPNVLGLVADSGGIASDSSVHLRFYNNGVSSIVSHMTWDEATAVLTLGYNNEDAIAVKAGGNVGIGTNNPTSKLTVIGLPVFANNAAAIAGGLGSGAFYRSGGDPDVVAVVH